MIQVDGVEYGRAHEIAARLGPDVTVAMVRNWARRDGLTSIRVTGHVYYRLDQAARIEAAKRRTTRGRPRPT